MSEVFLCVDCGRIGDKNSLVFYEMSVVGDEMIKKIMEVNHLGAFKCPVCNSRKVFYSKPELAPSISFPIPYLPPSIIPSVPPVDQGIIYTTLNGPTEATAPMDPAGIGIQNLPVPEEKPRPVVKFKNECDTCKKEFSSKINGATRCSDCIKKMIK